MEPNRLSPNDSTSSTFLGWRLRKTHVPGFVARAADLRAGGVKHVVCISVNDPFVMGAWSKDLGCEGKVSMFADTNAAFVKALGMAKIFDGLGGVRSKRFALMVRQRGGGC